MKKFLNIAILFLFFVVFSVCIFCEKNWAFFDIIFHSTEAEIFDKNIPSKTFFENNLKLENEFSAPINIQSGNEISLSLFAENSIKLMKNWQIIDENGENFQKNYKFCWGETIEQLCQNAGESRPVKVIFVSSSPFIKVDLLLTLTTLPKGVAISPVWSGEKNILFDGKPHDFENTLMLNQSEVNVQIFYETHALPSNVITTRCVDAGLYEVTANLIVDKNHFLYLASDPQKNPIITLSQIYTIKN